MRVVLLICTLLGSAANRQTLSGQFAGRRQLGISIESPVPRTEARRSLKALNRGTHWKEGALLVGLPTAVATYFFVQGSTGESGNALLNGLILGAAGAALGGLIGSFFPKSGDDNASAGGALTPSGGPARFEGATDCSGGPHWGFITRQCSRRARR